MKQKINIITGVLCVAALLISQTVSASGTYGISPANPTGEQASWLVHDIGQGQSFDDQVVVVNNGDQATSYSLYTVDAKVSPEGAFLPGNEDSPKNEIASWMSLSKETVTLQPGEKQTVDVTISIPKDQVVGKYAGAIMMQENAAVTASTGGAGATIATRVGLRAYIDVVEPTAVANITSQEDLKKDGSSKHKKGERKRGGMMPLVVIAILAIVGAALFMNKKNASCCGNSYKSKEKKDMKANKKEESEGSVKKKEKE